MTLRAKVARATKRERNKGTKRERKRISEIEKMEKGRERERQRKRENVCALDRMLYIQF